MKTLSGLLLLALVCTSCSWNPTRDNPADPASPFYVPPPPRNHPPSVVDSLLRVTTDCRQIGELSNFCSFTLRAQVADSDNNLLYDSVYALIQRHLPDPQADTIGLMHFDPLLQEFVIQRGQDEVPEQNLRDLVGMPVIVRARDDSGAIGSASTLFPAPVTIPWPVALAPVGNVYSQDTVFTLTPRLVWQRWGNATDGHHYAVSVDLYGILPVWGASDIAAADTFLFVTDTLINNLLYADVFYSWTLTVKDWRGNYLTGMPQFFKCQAPLRSPSAPRLSPFVKRES